MAWRHEGVWHQFQSSPAAHSKFRKIWNRRIWTPPHVRGCSEGSFHPQYLWNQPVFVFVFVFWLVTLINCLKGHMSLESLCSVVKTLIVSGARPSKWQGHILSCSLFSMILTAEQDGFHYQLWTHVQQKNFTKISIWSLLWSHLTRPVVSYSASFLTLFSSRPRIHGVPDEANIFNCWLGEETYLGKTLNSSFGKRQGLVR